MAVGAGAGAAYSAASCSCLAFIFLIFACSSPWTLWGGFVGSNGYVNLGMGPFVAGCSTGTFVFGGVTYVGSMVWWSDLNTQNTCNNPDVAPWVQANNLCPSGSFVIPSQAQGIQATIVLATLFSFFAAVLGFSVSGSRGSGGYSAAVCALLAMIFTIAAFAIWTTWPMSTSLQSAPGSVIPVWQAGGRLGLSGTIVIGYGASYVLTVLAFVCLLFATVTLFSVANRLDSEAAGSYGTGI